MNATLRPKAARGGREKPEAKKADPVAWSFSWELGDRPKQTSPYRMSAG